VPPDPSHTNSTHFHFTNSNYSTPHTPNQALSANLHSIFQIICFCISFRGIGSQGLRFRPVTKQFTHPSLKFQHTILLIAHFNSKFRPINSVSLLNTLQSYDITNSLPFTYLFYSLQFILPEMTSF